MVDPRSLSDVNGNYPGGDGNIHQTKKFTKRSIFSGFDVFRSQFPLQTIINPQMVNDMVNSLVELADENDSQFSPLGFPWAYLLFCVLPLGWQLF